MLFEIGNVVTLRDGRKGKVVGQLENKEYILATGKGGQISYFEEREVIESEKTAMEGTGLLDYNGKEIRIGHVTEIVLSDGTVRKFKVKKKTVVREIVSLAGFTSGTSKVAITGIVFEWNGHNLFPNVDEAGIPDNEKMIIVGVHYET